MAELSAIIDVEEHMCKNILKWSEENTQETAKTMTFITLLDYTCTLNTDVQTAMILMDSSHGFIHSFWSPLKVVFGPEQ